ncbi:FAD-linked oxidase C-terminal domain-containing protein [Halothiobacillus sp.]|uniref:FAD-linked oxidase C-terminal domain-containing protein n=1 Tax=Halothiobacillus sp. TaxID=1891311 RepID=UPI002AD2D38D|nr:FAD-linked oxidase C-terminal domain-containing protein [Halothiobacillus sp.]
MSIVAELAAESTPLSAERLDVLIRRLRTVLPDAALLTTTEAMKPFECDGLSAIRRMPAVVALPESIDQIQAVLRICAELNVPVVARGAGTGLSGGALPSADGLLLSLAKFKQILHIDSVNRTARVQPGVRNLAISEAAAPYGLYYAPDPSSQIACTIGGNVAENSGGVHCLKYGLTVHNVLEVTFITIDGEKITVGGSTLDSSGYDILALMNGSEGMLGVMVEVLVRLLPVPECAKVLMAAFDNLESAGQAVADIIAAGIIPAGLEMMDNNAIRAAEAFVHAGYPTEAAAILLCELDGTTEEVDELLAEVEAVVQRAGASGLWIARDAEERARFWAGRKAAFSSVGRLSPDYYCMDGTIPRRMLASVLTQIDDMSREFGLKVANVFHAGDGNLHPLILFDANKPGELDQAEAFGERILTLCVAVGGSVTGEHGVGVEKLAPMCAQFKPQELIQFYALKAAFDPQGLLNPGKAVPTLQRCAEFGAMHVHHNHLPHPDLPRF